jgi:antitoxin component YwqK of YwqJK toxin-antitoxin module
MNLQNNKDMKDNNEKVIVKYKGTDRINLEYYVNSDNKRNGTFKSYDFEGNLTFEGEFKNGIQHGESIVYTKSDKYEIFNYRDGILTGAYAEFYNNKLYVTGQYYNGEKDGLWEEVMYNNTVWYLDGQTTTQEEYLTETRSRKLEAIAKI